jgi:hypothetical protein
MCLDAFLKCIWFEKELNSCFFNVFSMVLIYRYKNKKIIHHVKKKVIPRVLLLLSRARRK